MKKTLKLAFFLLFQLFFSQELEMKLNIIDKKKVEFLGKQETEYTLEIKLSNHSKKNYAFPIDTLGYIPSTPNYESCDFYRKESYYTLKIRPYIEDMEEKAVAVEKKIEKELPSEEIANREKKHEKALEEWRKKNRYIAWEDDIDVDKNRYLFTNMRVIKSGQSITYIRKFNPQRMNYDSLGGAYDSYLLEKGKKYKFMVSLCLEYPYNYFTIEQERKYKKFNFPPDSPISNEIEIEW